MQLPPTAEVLRVRAQSTLIASWYRRRFAI
jgi:hypothetical protein